MYKRIVAAVFTIIIFFTLFNKTEQAQVNADTVPSVQSEAAILIDADTGEVIFAKNEHKKMFPASITKVLTALLTIEKGGLDTVFTANSDTVKVAPEGTTAGIKVGEELTVEQLLYFTMIVSGNEAANGLGQYVSGDIKTFCDLMNKRAKELGAQNTFFWNTNGLNDEPPAKDQHMTTAYDMALIMKKAVTYPKFVEVISTYSYKTGATNKNKARNYTNSNQMINKKSTYYYEYCVGGKTGWTTPAGNTLVTYAIKGDKKLICVVLKANGKQNAYKDSKTLYNYGFKDVETTSPPVKTSPPNTTTPTIKTSPSGTTVFSTTNTSENSVNPLTSAPTDTVTGGSEVTANTGQSVAGTENVADNTSPAISGPPPNTQEGRGGEGGENENSTVRVWTAVLLGLLFVIIGGVVFYYVRKVVISRKNGYKWRV